MNDAILSGLVNVSDENSKSWKRVCVRVTENFLELTKPTGRRQKEDKRYDTRTIISLWKNFEEIKIFTVHKFFHFKIPTQKELGRMTCPSADEWYDALYKFTEIARAQAKYNEQIQALKEESRHYQNSSSKHSQAVSTIKQWAHIANTVNVELFQQEYIPLQFLKQIEKCTDPSQILKDRHTINFWIDKSILKYQRLFYEETSDEMHIVPGGFGQHSSVVELTLRGRTSALEAEAAGNYRELDKEQAAKQRTADMSRSSQILKCRGNTTVLTAVSDLKNDSVDAHHLVEDKILKIKECVLQNNPINMTDAQAREMAEICCNHLTSTVANYASKTAVQLCFGVAGLILIKPSQDHVDIVEPGMISIDCDSIKIEVPSCWWAVEDNSLFWALERDLDPKNYWGAIDATYTYNLTYEEFVNGVCHPGYITVQRRKKDVAMVRKGPRIPTVSSKASLNDSFTGTGSDPETPRERENTALLSIRSTVLGFQKSKSSASLSGYFNS